MKLKELRKDEWFTKKSIEEPKENQVWVKGGYDPSEKKYEIHPWSNINKSMLMDGDKEVFVDFIF